MCDQHYVRYQHYVCGQHYVGNTMWATLLYVGRTLCQPKVRHKEYSLNKEMIAYNFLVATKKKTRVFVCSSINHCSDRIKQHIYLIEEKESSTLIVQAAYAHK